MGRNKTTTMPDTLREYELSRKDHVVYALGDPRTGMIRYVGCTQNLGKRYSDHIRNREANAPKKEWIDELKAAGMQPTLIILEKGLNQKHAYTRERYWIAQHSKKGELLNRILPTRVPAHGLEPRVNISKTIEEVGKTEQFYTLDEAAMLLDLRQYKLRNLARSGTIKGVKIEERWYFERSYIDAHPWLLDRNTHISIHEYKKAEWYTRVTAADLVRRKKPPKSYNTIDEYYDFDHLDSLVSQGIIVMRYLGTAPLYSKENVDSYRAKIREEKRVLSLSTRTSP